MTTVAIAARILTRLLSEDKGADLVEYALLCSFVTVGGVATYTAMQTSMQGVYNGWNTASQNAWEPCAPGQTPGSTCY